MRRVLIAAVSVTLALSAIAPAFAQINPNPLSGATPTLERQVNLSGVCALRVVVPVDRSNPAATVSATVTAQLRQRGNLRPTSLGTPRINDTGSAIVFTFALPSDSCNQPLRVTPTVVCSVSMAGAGVTQTDSYNFPSSVGFAQLTEVTIPRSC